MIIQKKPFGYLDNQPITLFTVRNSNGFEVSCINYGCVITKILAADRRGCYENIVLGYDTLAEYGKNPMYLGAVVGRVAGRIKESSFHLEENIYQLTTNERNNHLHGGTRGFSHILWDAVVLEGTEATTIEFSHISMDGEEGYPGNLNMKIAYTISNTKDELAITYTGVSDRDTLVNVTNHSYFNLSGNLKRDVLNHELTMDSPAYLELNEELLPTGNLVPVDGSVFDFRRSRKIADGLHSSHPQIVLVGYGYDHPFLMDENQNNIIILTEVESGRKLTVDTTESVVVVYTGNNLESSDNLESMRGVKLRNYLGVCLETQGPPDSIHHPHLQSIILQAGDEYFSKTIYSFGVI